MTPHMSALQSRRLLARLWGDRSGLAAVELALVLPFLILTLAGLVDYSRLILTEMQVRSAAQAGADYALQHGWNEAGVLHSVTGASSLAINADPAPRVLKGCVSGTNIAETSESTCPSGAAAGEYVMASAWAPFETLMPWPGLALPDTVSASAMTRVK